MTSKLVGVPATTANAGAFQVNFGMHHSGYSSSPTEPKNEQYLSGAQESSGLEPSLSTVGENETGVTAMRKTNDQQHQSQNCLSSLHSPSTPS